MGGASEQHVSPPGRVFRCAWCGGGTSIDGGMPYFSYVEIDGAMGVVPGDPDAWSRSDGICPVHFAALYEELRAASCS